MLKAREIERGKRGEAGIYGRDWERVFSLLLVFLIFFVLFLFLHMVPHGPEPGEEAS